MNRILKKLGKQNTFIVNPYESYYERMLNLCTEYIFYSFYHLVNEMFLTRIEAIDITSYIIKLMASIVNRNVTNQRLLTHQLIKMITHKRKIN